MENQEIMEQPMQEEIVQAADVDLEDGTVISSSNGSIGKFKDAESLLDAYNNLQAEFTKKCQKLSEFEKTSKQQIESESVAIYEREGWDNKVATFLENNQDAKQFASEICNNILTDSSLRTKDNALEIAYANVMKKHFVLPDKVAENSDFLSKYVLNNPTVKQQIITEYVQSLQQNKVPMFVSKQNGSQIAFKTQPKANSMSEAKQMVQKLFDL